MFQAGCFHPNANLADANAQVARGRLGAFVSSNPDTGALRSFTPDQEAEVLIPFGWDGKATPVYDMGYGTVGYTAFKQADEGKILKLLDLINWLSAPFGASEWVDKNYGTEGEDWTRSSDGDLVPTALLLDLVLVLGVVGVTRLVDDALSAGHDHQRAHQTKRNPTNGSYSDSNAKVGTKIQAEIRDKMIDIVTGRAKIDTWDAAVKRWRDGGGDKIREEFQAVLPADAS